MSRALTAYEALMLRAHDRLCGAALAGVEDPAALLAEVREVLSECARVMEDPGELYDALPGIARALLAKLPDGKP